MAVATLQMAGLALAMNYGVHIGSSMVFDTFCVPHSVWDVARSIVATSSPVCSFVLTTMQVTQNNFAVLVTTTVASTISSMLKT
jgi:hypothetical protein